MIMILLLIICGIIFWSVNKISSKIETNSLHLEKIYSRIDEHAKMTEEAHKHTIEEKRRSGR